MKTRKLLMCCMMNIAVGFGLILLISLPVATVLAFNKYSYNSNTISGYVFNLQRQPVGEVTVELLDDFARMIARTRTNASGYYYFGRVPSGKFRVRVLAQMYDYQEQEQEVEIINFRRETASGTLTTSGFDNVQRDFYLRPRKDSQIPSRSESIFVQEIPKEAKEIYSKAIEALDNKKDQQGLKDLKSAIESFPNYYDAIERLGTEYVKLKYYEAAEILLNRAVQINPRGFKSWYGLAYSQYSQDKTNQAMDAIQKATSLNQFSIEAFILEGVLHKKSKDYKKAEKLFKKAKDLAKGSVAEVNWQLALLYGNNLNRYREAADELELYLKANPDSKEAENIKKLIKQFREKAKNNSN